MPPVRAGAAFPRFTATQELFRVDGLTLSSGGDTVTAGIAGQVPGAAGGLIDVSSVGNGLLMVGVGGVSGGTPSLAVFFDVQDAYGNWVLVSNSTSIGGTAITGAGVVAGNISAGSLLTFSGRIRWTVGGSTPSFTGVSFSLFGR